MTVVVVVVKLSVNFLDTFFVYLFCYPTGNPMKVNRPIFPDKQQQLFVVIFRRILILYLFFFFFATRTNGT